MRGSAYLHDGKNMLQYLGQNITITAKIEQEPKMKEKYTHLKMSNISINYSTSALKSQVYATVSGDLDIKSGDTVTISGTPTEGFGDYAVSVWRADLVEISRNSRADPFT